ncbi:MAG: hypothetical protein H6739_02635 [Alphaproteobacteria bacterium]|nr:hypothetical protein [Alphaproteobacteria bacterium]
MSDRPETPIKYTRTAEAPARGSRQDIPPPKALVVVEPASLDAAQRQLAAQRAGVSLQLVETLAASKLPLPVEPAESLTLARGRAAQLSTELPGVSAVDPGHTTPTWAMAAPVVALLAIGPAVLLGLWWLIPLLLVAGAVATGVGLREGAVRQRAYTEALDLLRDAAPAAPQDERAAALLARIGALRAAMRSDRVPEAAARDIGVTLDDLGQDLNTLALEPDDAGFARVGEALDALEASLGRLDDEPGLSDAADRLRLQAKALKATRTELPEDDRKRRAAAQAVQKKQ